MNKKKKTQLKATILITRKDKTIENNSCSFPLYGIPFQTYDSLPSRSYRRRTGGTRPSPARPYRPRPARPQRRTR